MKSKKKSFNFLSNIDNENLLTKATNELNRGVFINKGFIISRNESKNVKNIFFINTNFFLEYIKNENTSIPLDEKFINYINKYEYIILKTQYENSKLKHNFIYEKEKEKIFLMIRNIKKFIFENQINLIIFEGTKLQIFEILFILISNFFSIKIFLLKENKYFNKDLRNNFFFSELINNIQILNIKKVPKNSSPKNEKN